MQKQFITLEKSTLDSKKRTITGVIGSTGDRDRHGDTVNPDGWILNNYLENPVLLFGHDYWSFPIGKSLKTYVQDGMLKFDLFITDATEQAREAFALIEQGILNAVSVGFVVKKWGVSGQDPYSIMQQELLELSVVPVGANPKARIKEFIATAKEFAPNICKQLEDSMAAENDRDAELITSVGKMVDEKLTAFTDAQEEKIRTIVKLEIAESKKEETTEPTPTPAEADPQPNPEVPPVEAKDSSELAVLTSIRDALRQQDKSIGLALKGVNEYLSTKK